MPEGALQHFPRRPAPPHGGWRRHGHLDPAQSSPEGHPSGPTLSERRDVKCWPLPSPRRVPGAFDLSRMLTAGCRRLRQLSERPAGRQRPPTPTDMHRRAQVGNCLYRPASFAAGTESRGWRIGTSGGAIVVATRPVPHGSARFCELRMALTHAETASLGPLWIPTQGSLSPQVRDRVTTNERRSVQAPSHALPRARSHAESRTRERVHRFSDATRPIVGILAWGSGWQAAQLLGQT